MTAPMPLVGILRHGLLLSLGWVVCAALALRHHGFGWTLLLLVVWAWGMRLPFSSYCGGGGWRRGSTQQQADRAAPPSSTSPTVRDMRVMAG